MPCATRRAPPRVIRASSDGRRLRGGPNGKIPAATRHPQRESGEASIRERPCFRAPRPLVRNRPSRRTPGRRAEGLNPRCGRCGTLTYLREIGAITRKCPAQLPQRLRAASRGSTVSARRRHGIQAPRHPLRRQPVFARSYARNPPPTWAKPWARALFWAQGHCGDWLGGCLIAGR